MKFGLPAPERWDYGCALPHLASSYAGVEPRGLCVPVMYSVYMMLSARVVSSICMLEKLRGMQFLLESIFLYMSVLSSQPLCGFIFPEDCAGFAFLPWFPEWLVRLIPV